MNTNSAIVVLLLLVAPINIMGARNLLKVSDEDEEISYFPDSDEEEEIESVQAEASDIFIVDDSAGEGGLVAQQNEEYADADITHLMEIRTKLKFKGNKMELRNPEMIPTLVSDINEQQGKHEGAKFLFCLHIGTSGDE